MLDKTLQDKLENSIQRKKYFENIDNFLDSPVIKIITGARRVGKSYYLYSVIKYLLEQKNLKKSQIFYINKERIEFESIRDYQDLNKLFEKTNIDTSQKFFLGIDEAQEIIWFEKFLNSIYSKYPHWIFFVTGSNSKLLSSKYSSLLSGRYIEKHIYPLTFNEYCLFAQKTGTFWDFKEYLQYGAMPQIPFIQDKNLKYEYLKWVYNTVFTKDIVEFFGIRNVPLLRKIHQYLFKETWSLFTAQNISKYFQSQHIKVSVDTVVNYLWYSQDAFLFQEINRFDIKGKKVFEINSKIYPLDLWLRNTIIGFDRFSDREKLLEQTVLLHLLACGREVKIWILWNKEIDFIASKQSKKVYIQVCYLLSTDKVIQREFGNLEQIKDNYPKFVVSTDESFDWGINWIQHINIIDFLKTFE